MSRKRILISVVVILALAALIYVQAKEWRTFDWAEFWRQTDQVLLYRVLLGVALIYVAYLLRAIRWRILLGPKVKASIWAIYAPTIIGFTGLALLGRPGEFVRPYLIARRTGQTFASQIAVWTVERIFDLGAFAALMLWAIFFSPSLDIAEFGGEKSAAMSTSLHRGGLLLVVFVAALALGAFLVSTQGERVAQWVAKIFPGDFGQKLSVKVRDFGTGLHTIHGPVSFLGSAVTSVLMWWVIALAYKEVALSYGEAMSFINVPRVLLLMGSSMVGSILQLPGVGGGSQLATISALNNIFHVQPETATSCGILLWLVTFMAVIPFGLVLARLEHLSLRKLSEETHQTDAKPAA